MQQSVHQFDADILRIGLFRLDLVDRPDLVQHLGQFRKVLQVHTVQERRVPSDPDVTLALRYRPVVGGFDAKFQFVGGEVPERRREDSNSEGSLESQPYSAVSGIFFFRGFSALTSSSLRSGGVF